MKKYLVSACLLGMACRYNGTACPTALPGDGALIPFCPETAGGLPIPRLPAEIVGGDGIDVWQGRARVLNTAGKDITAEYKAGATAALHLCLRENVSAAVLKARSPSCSCRFIYDGSHNGVLHAGVGVTTALLLENGIAVQEAE